MRLFNSLGSNYDYNFVISSLLVKNNDKSSDKLRKFLEGKYSGKAILVYKGREAITLALQSTGLAKDCEVAFNGFTCYAVYKAVKDAGYSPVYIDIYDRELNFSQKALRTALGKHPKIKALLIQNTLGTPCDIESIARICKKKKIILIEDLAHCIGTRYQNGREAGTVGDLVALSFSQDKMIDAISGGALIIRNSQFALENISFLKVDDKTQKIDQKYPLFTYIIRKTYAIGFGKIVHALLKRFRLLSNPMQSGSGGDVHTLPNWYCELIYTQFEELAQNLTHRRNIADIYAKSIDDNVQSGVVSSKINNSSNLRFPIFTKNRSSLINFLKQKGIYVSDIWYDAPIAPKKYLHMSNYKKGECPQSEKVSNEILNLPTHKNISEKQARYIAQQVNHWINNN